MARALSGPRGEADTPRPTAVGADNHDVAKKRRRTRKASTPTFTVYVIELSRDCVDEPCALAPVYVGQTAHTPEHRFEQHKAGGKLAAGKPHRYGVRLRYDLMKAGPFVSRAEAEAAEKQVAEALTRRGHRVFWG